MGLDRTSGQSVAIKFLEESSTGAERFAREVTLLTELSHPSIVRYIAHGTLGRRPYLVMEWVEGRPLSHFLSDGLTMRESVEVTSRIAQALSVVHVRGVVHRALDPSNIMFVDGRLEDLKLIDFGFVREIGQPGFTRVGTVIGTPGYLSPEQARGEYNVDSRTDVFSLGCVLYTCLSGAAPFSAQHLLATLIKVMFQDPVPLSELRPDVPSPLLDLVQRMVAKERHERPDSAAVVVEELRALGELPDTERRPATPAASSLFASRFRPDQRPTVGAIPSALAATNSHTPDTLMLLIGLDGQGGFSKLLANGNSAAAHAQIEPMVALIDSAKAMIKAADGRSSLLADGTLVGLFANPDAAAAPAARAALDIRALISQRLGTNAPIVLGASGGGLGEDALDRLVQLLIEESFRGVVDDDSEVPASAVRVAEHMRKLLPGEFTVERYRTGSYLTLS
ncbi:MAG: hypothetical protein Tsb0020_48950 [Haliangiales bacterium]